MADDRGVTVDMVEMRRYGYSQPTSDNYCNQNHTLSNVTAWQEQHQSHTPQGSVNSFIEKPNKTNQNCAVVNQNLDIKHTKCCSPAYGCSTTNQINEQQSRDDAMFDTKANEIESHGKRSIETGDIIEAESTRMSTWSLSSTQFFFINPYNVRNYRFTRTFKLQGWLTYVLICLYPGVKYMESSDYLYMNGKYERSRQYANLSTALFAVGILVMVVLLAFVIFFVVYFSM